MLDLDMGRYALFVWPAWGVSALVLIALAARALIAWRRWKRELQRLTDADETARSQAAQRAAGQKQ